MREHVRAMLLGSLVADALALGVHWVYNTNVIDRKFGRLKGYHDPLTSYHKGKKAGEFTHYGDQMMVLMESVEAVPGFDLETFTQHWTRFFETYTGYFDGATKETLQHLSEGKDIHSCGSGSDDLAGAIRIAPLCYVYDGNVDKLVEAARLQTAFTHNNQAVIDSAAFLGRTTAMVLAGTPPVQAVEAVVDQNFKGHAIEALVEEGLDSRQIETRQAIADFGQACSVEAALPGTIHLIAKYADDVEAALIENVMAGGDSSSRGMPAGMILGAYHGMDAIPDKWLESLTAKTQVEALMNSLDEKQFSV